MNWIFFINLSLQIGNPYKYLFLLLDIDWRKYTKFTANNWKPIEMYFSFLGNPLIKNLGKLGIQESLYKI